MSAKQNYPQAALLPLPVNIDPSESMRFSPQRARDITSNTIATNIWNARSFDITIDSSKYDVKSDADPHVGSYDCTGAVSLNSSMQSNVPSPFGGMHNYTHLNMPGGQWSQSSKWMSHDLHSSHYTNLRREVRNNMLYDEKNALSTDKGIFEHKNNLHGKSSSSSDMWMTMSRSNVMRSSFACLSPINHSSFYHLNVVASNQTNHRMFSDKKNVVKSNEQKKEDESNTQSEPVALTPRAKLKNAIKDYGSTVLIFHITISLVSLGIFYQLVNRYVVMKT